jgi:outer membrane lipoprotein-sorting protein
MEIDLQGLSLNARAMLLVVGMAMLVLPASFAFAEVKAKKARDKANAKVESAAENPEEILQRADAIRSPKGDFRMRVEVTDSEKSVSQMEVWIKGRDKTLIKTLSPARDKGRNLLMLGEDMWAFIPNLKRTVRVSLSQRLMGEAANGDIARLGWMGDYIPKLESSDANSWLLNLLAARKGLTYERLQLRVDKSSYRPIKASYVTKSGVLLKTAEFRAYKKLAGEIRPSEMLIRDGSKVKAKGETLIQIQQMESSEVADAMFNQTNLGNP